MITTLVIIFLFLIALVGLLYFFKPKKEKEAIKGGGKISIGVPQFAKTWWEERGDDGRKLFLYVLTIIIAYAAGYFAPEGKDVIYRGAAALIVLHFIWTFSSGKAGKLTWTIVVGMLVYFVLALMYPNDASRIRNASWEISKNVMSSVANGMESLSGNSERETPVDARTSAISSQRIVSVPYIIPIDASITLENLPGYRISSMECPPENVIEIADTARQIDCAGQITLNENELRNKKEIVFFQKPGGTETSTVVVWWTKV